MDFRPGDWLCACSAHNYASKSACFKCKLPREVSGGSAQQPGFPQQQQQYQSQAYSSFGNGGIVGGLGAGLGAYGNGGVAGFGAPDSNEPDYGGQFAQQLRYDGFQGSQNPLQALAGFDTASLFSNALSSAPLPANFRPGDWLCACGNHNYAIRTSCGKCGKVKAGAVGNSLPGNFRPGDWMCKCGNHNYQSRSVCGKCQEPKDSAKQAVTPQMAPNFQVGDWMCTCGAHNYQSKTQCYKCSQPKESAQAELPITSGFRPGDWLCESCKNHNYASRIVCGRCKTPKPSEEIQRERSPTTGARDRSRSPRR